MPKTTTIPSISEAPIVLGGRRVKPPAAWQGLIAGQLISAAVIRRRVIELGQLISRVYTGKRITLVALLDGTIVFLADLIRAIDHPLQIDLIKVSSYGAGTGLDARVNGKGGR